MDTQKLNMVGLFSIGFLNLSTINILGWGSFLVGKAVLCIKEYLPASLASTF